MTEPLRLAVLISGAGRTLRNLLQRIAAGTLPCRVEVVLCSRRGAAGAAIPGEFGVPLVQVFREDFPDPPSFGRAVEAALAPFNFDLIVLAGFLHYLPIAPAWRGRIVNIHPALLPRHGGRGFYGERVHKAVLKAKDRESGCTVHWVDEVYDHGETILQKKVPVLPGDTPHTLAARVFDQECEALPEALAKLAREWKR